MIDTQQLKSIPLVGTFVAGLLYVLGMVGDLWHFIELTAGTWFPISSAFGGLVAPSIGLADAGTILLVGSAVVFIVIKGEQLAGRAWTRYKGDND